MKVLKKLIIGGIIALIVVGMVLIINNITTKDAAIDVANIPDGSQINFQLYKSYEVDTSGLRKKFLVVEGTPFVYFVQVYRLDSWKEMGEFWETNFQFPEFDFDSDDFQDKHLVMSFGREVLEIEKIGSHSHGDSEEIEAAITFGEEYHDQTMYLYIMDKIHLYMGLGSEFYIMDGSEKIFQGYSIHDLNESYPYY